MLKNLAPFLLALALYGGTLWNWQEARNEAKREAEKRLSASASEAVALIDAEALGEALAKGSIPKATYEKLLDPLVAFHNARLDLAYVYTASKLGNTIYTILDTNQKVRAANPTFPYAYPGKPLEKIPDADQGLQRALNGEATVLADDSLLRNDVGADIAKYQPILNKNGQVVGVLAVSMNRKVLDEKLSDANNELYRNLGLLTILFLGGHLILRSRNRKIVDSENAALRIQNQFRTMTDRMPGAVFIFSNPQKTGNKGQLLFASAGVEHLLGVSPQAAESSWKFLTDMLPPEMRELEEKKIQVSRENKTPWECEIHEAGRDRWVQIRAIPKDAEDGAVTWFGTITDITSQKVEAQKLRETNNLLKAISGAPDAKETLNGISHYAVENSNCACIIYFVSDGKIRAVEGAHVPNEIAGLLAEEKEVGESTGGAAVAAVQKEPLHINSIKDSGFYRKNEDLRNELMNSGFISTTLYPLRDKEGTCLGVLEILYQTPQQQPEDSPQHEQATHLALSVLEKLQTVRVLKENEHKYRLLFEASPIGICETNPEGEIVFCNEAFQKITDPTTRKSLSGHHANEGRKELKQGNKTFLTETLPINKASGEPHLITFLSDISEQKHKEEQAVNSKQLAEAANKAKSEFLAMMSHEIRTPLNGVIGFADILLGMGKTIPDHARESVTRIKQCGSSLLLIINDILSLSKIEAGRVELEAIPFDLAETLQVVQSTILPKAIERNVKIEIETTDLPEAVLGDETRLRQILVNLAGNAVKFTKDGTVTLNASYSNGFVTLKVIDDGIGISQENQKKLFQPFSQADSSTTRKYGGTGLGLSISRGLTQLMKGTIELESEVGKGSTFTVRFPAPAAEKVASKNDTEDNFGEEDLLPLNVLVAEDMEVNRIVVGEMLKSSGHAIEFAEDGKQAVAKAMELKDWVDVIFMDMLMPEMDGLEATRAIRANGLTEIPIIALTANAMEEDREKCLAAGMNNYISKPIESSVVKKALRKFQSIKRHRLLAQAAKPADPEITPETEEPGIEIDLEEPLEPQPPEEEQPEHPSEDAPDLGQEAEEALVPEEDIPAGDWGEFDSDQEEEQPPKPTEAEPDREETSEEEELLNHKMVENLFNFSTFNIIEQLIDLAEKGAKASIATLENKTSSQDDRRKAAHKLNGSTGNLGCTALRAVAQTLEEHYRANAEYHPDTDKLEPLAKKTIDALRQILEKKKSE